MILSVSTSGSLRPARLQLQLLLSRPQPQQKRLGVSLRPRALPGWKRTKMRLHFVSAKKHAVALGSVGGKRWKLLLLRRAPRHTPAICAGLKLKRVSMLWDEEWAAAITHLGNGLQSRLRTIASDVKRLPCASSYRSGGDESVAFHALNVQLGPLQERFLRLC